jgi:hypothetical protein
MITNQKISGLRFILKSLIGNPQELKMTLMVFIPRVL